MCGEEFELLDRINRFSRASGDNWHCGLRLSDDVKLFGLLRPWA
jgi:hypothetical protein